MQEKKPFVSHMAAPYTQGHAYDCGACGEPCPFAGHEDCPKGGGFTMTRVVRCFDHTLRKVGEVKPKAEGTRKVKSGSVIPFSEWERINQRDTGLSRGSRNWEPTRPQPRKAEPKKPVVIADPEMLRLLEGEEAKAVEAVDKQEE